MAPETRLSVLPRGRDVVGPSHFLVRAVGLLSRTLLTRWCNSVQVHGLDRFVKLVDRAERVRPSNPAQAPRGVLTFANHISVMDDPTIFGAFPKAMLNKSHTTRWTLGASDIMFTNPLFSWIFRSGQVLPTDRGRGVFQPSLDQSIDLLERGGWVHVFPEGYVNMSRQARVRRFKWGVARMLLEAGSPAKRLTSMANAEPFIAPLRPYIVPIWISGFDAMMPEPRSAPRWMPRPGADVTITIGEPINQVMEPVLDRMLDYIGNDGGDVQQNAPEAALALKESVADLEHISSAYPIPSARLFSERTPLKPPPGGVPWPVPLSNSRSGQALQHGLDSERARLARSFVAAELRAHLVRVGDASGIEKTLTHQLMADKDERD